MQIGIFTDTFYPEINGVATSCYMLQQELEKLGHQIHVFAPKCKGWENCQRGNIHYLPSLPFIGLKDRNVALPSPVDTLGVFMQHFDVIHTNSEFVMGYFGRYIARNQHCAYVHTYHTAWEDYTYYVTHGHQEELAKDVVRKYSEWWCNHFDRVITPSGKTRELLRQYGVSAPMDVIPSGMDIERFSPDRHPSDMIETIRQECGVKPGERVLLNVGRIAKEKNIDQIIRVFPKVNQRFPDVRFVIIGEGPMKEELQRKAETMECGHMISFTGPKPWEKIDQYYAIGDVFCSCSHSETQGLTYVEAMASGVCVCAVKDPCLDGVIEDGVNGILSGDSDEELIEALSRAFGEEGKRISQISAESAKPFGKEAFARKVLACYENAIRDHETRKEEE